MVFGRINAFSAYDIFSLWWVYQDVTPSYVEERLYNLANPPSGPAKQ